MTSSEVPLAFVVLSAAAARRANEGEAGAAEIKKSIIQATRRVFYIWALNLR